MTPLYDIYSHIVYTMRPSDIRSVMVHGNFVVNDGELKTADESNILYKARKWSEKIRDGEG
jgi:5-methylthioadenosine/S-adenosylhomocysteine deaminase